MPDAQIMQAHGHDLHFNRVGRAGDDALHLSREDLANDGFESHGSVSVSDWHADRRPWRDCRYSLKPIARFVVEAAILCFEIERSVLSLAGNALQCLINPRKPLLLFAGDVEFLPCNAILQHFDRGAARQQ